MTTTSSPHHVLEIPELVEAILHCLERDSDLVTVACVSRKFTEMALRVLWNSPELDGSPLVGMTALFPPDVRDKLHKGEDMQMRISSRDFDRFDYYARFIRVMSLWHHTREGFIAHVLCSSRPDVWMFPALEELHLGASGKQMKTVRSYLSPSIRRLSLNHWDIEDREWGGEADPIRQMIVHVCTQLPLLEALDFTDVRYENYETDEKIVDGMAELALRLQEFTSYSFAPLHAVFAAMTHSRILHTVFLDLTTLGGPGRVTLEDVIAALRDAFTALRSLGLLCSLDQASRVLDGSRRNLDSLDLRIDSAMVAGQLHQVVSSVYAASPSLRSFRIASASPLECASEPPIHVAEALEPLLGLPMLEHISISMSFEGRQTINDRDMERLFRAWPRLKTCTLESDPEDESVPNDANEPDFGLSLACLVSAAKFCPALCDLTVSYINTTSIPSFPPEPIPKSDVSLHLHLARSHVHNHEQVVGFVGKLWPSADIRLDGCIHYSAFACSLGEEGGGMVDVPMSIHS